jgi:hypothetical protein
MTVVRTMGLLYQRVVQRPFATLLAGGDRRSLGRAAEVVALTLADATRIGELFACLLDADEIVRMRAADALEKVVRERPELGQPFVERLLADVAAIDQPSVRWHLAQLLRHVALTPSQRERAIAVLRGQLAASDDWLVVNETLTTLASFARDDGQLRAELRQILSSRLGDGRRAVAKRAMTLLAGLPRE